MTTADWIKGRRELLDDATEAPWTPEDVYGLVAPTKIDGYTHPVERAETIRQGAADAALIADARTSLPLTLDALDAVLAQHRPVSYAATANCGLVLYEVCPTCHDKAGVHPCGCWRDEDQIHICAECNKVWPCATAEAIETALAGGCRECHQTDGHHKLDCGRRTT